MEGGGILVNPQHSTTRSQPALTTKDTKNGKPLRRPKSRGCCQSPARSLRNLSKRATHSQLSGLCPERSVFETRHLVKLVFEPGPGVGQQSGRWSLRRVCWERFEGHKRRNYMVDSEFSPAYTCPVKSDRLNSAKDRLNTGLSIIC